MTETSENNYIWRSVSDRASQYETQPTLNSPRRPGNESTASGNYDESIIIHGGGSILSSVNTTKNNICVKCLKAVYKAEEVFAVGVIWHRPCFTCGGKSNVNKGCNRVLTTAKFFQHNGVPYCTACYTKNISKFMGKHSFDPNMTRGSDDSVIDSSSERNLPDNHIRTLSTESNIDGNNFLTTQLVHSTLITSIPMISVDEINDKSLIGSSTIDKDKSDEMKDLSNTKILDLSSKDPREGNMEIIIGDRDCFASKTVDRNNTEVVDLPFSGGDYGLSSTNDGNNDNFPIDIIPEIPTIMSSTNDIDSPLDVITNKPTKKVESIITNMKITTERSSQDSFLSIPDTDILTYTDNIPNIPITLQPNNTYKDSVQLKKKSPLILPLNNSPTLSTLTTTSITTPTTPIAEIVPEPDPKLNFSSPSKSLNINHSATKPDKQVTLCFLPCFFKLVINP